MISFQKKKMEKKMMCILSWSHMKKLQQTINNDSSSNNKNFMRYFYHWFFLRRMFQMIFHLKKIEIKKEKDQEGGESKQKQPDIDQDKFHIYH